MAKWQTDQDHDKNMKNEQQKGVKNDLSTRSGAKRSHISTNLVSYKQPVPVK